MPASCSGEAGRIAWRCSWPTRADLWVKKDIGHWTIPKGEVEPGEEFVAVARREFAEETGHEAPNHPLIDLGQITQKSGKLVLGWAVEGDLDPSTAVSNTYDMEWPPDSGVVQTFPEIDRLEWFDLNEARRRLKAAQVPFLDRLQADLAATNRSAARDVDGASRNQQDGDV